MATKRDPQKPKPLYTHKNPDEIKVKADKSNCRFVKVDERTWVLKPIHPKTHKHEEVYN